MLIKSEPTIRKIRSEALNIRKRDKNDNIDLVLMWQEHSEYIKQVAFPLNIKMFSSEQLAILKHSKDCHLYFDATGSVVRYQFHKDRTVYYYCAVVVTNTQRVCPIFEMISWEHATANIQDLFS